jgi:hypothetical protein
MHRACCWGTGPQRCRPSFSDVIACTHRRPSARSSRLANPTTRYSPARHRARNVINALPAFASISSQRSCPRCTQRTTEVQRRQLCHPSETRCQRRCPSISDVIDCMHRRPSARPSQTPPPATAPRATAPAHSPQLYPMHSRRSHAPAHSPAGHRCTQLTAEVQRRQLRHPSETRCQRRCSSISDGIACTHRRPSARL